MYKEKQRFVGIGKFELPGSAEGTFGYEQEFGRRLLIITL